MRCQSVDDGADIAVDEIIEIITGKIYTVIRNAPLGEIVGADTFGAVAGTHLAFALLSLLRVLLLHHGIEKPGA